MSVSDESSPVHTPSDMITFVFNGELATSGDKSVSSDAVKWQMLRIAQLYANEQRISWATTNRSEESVSVSSAHKRADFLFEIIWL